MKFYVVTLTIYSILATVLVVALAMENRQLKQNPRGKPAPVNYDDVNEINLSGAPTIGAENAPITVVEFTDFECPYCKKASDSLTRLLAEYPGKLKVVFKSFPLKIHPNAVPAANAALAAGAQGKFWEMHNALFANTAGLSNDLYLKEAAKLGLDIEQFMADMEAPDINAAVEADLAEGLALEVSGTPTFFVNGVLVRGPSYEVLKNAIEHFLKEQS